MVSARPGKNILTAVLHRSDEWIKWWALQCKLQFNSNPNKKYFDGYIPLSLIIVLRSYVIPKNTWCLFKIKIKILMKILRKKFKACNKLISSIKFVSSFLPRKSLSKIFKFFVWPHLSYGNILHDKPASETLISHHHVWKCAINSV